MSSSNGVIRKSYQNAGNKGETVWLGRKFKDVAVVAVELNRMRRDDFAVTGVRMCRNGN